MKKFLPFIVLLFFAIASCTENVLIDNALDEKLHIKIDEKSFDLDANSLKEMKIKKGEHFLISTNTNGDTIVNSKININEKGIINASKTTYVVWKNLFCDEKDYGKYQTKLNIKDTVSIDNIDFVNVDFNFLDDAFIAKQWDLGLDEKMPDTLETKDDDEYKIISKIYRPKQIKEEFGYIGDIDFNDLTEEEINNILKNR